MTDGPNAQAVCTPQPCCKFLEIFKSFRLASRFPNVALALVALLATFAWGGLLDVCWKWADRGVPVNSIDVYIAGGSDKGLVGNLMDRSEQATGVPLGKLGQPSTETGGLFSAWYRHEARWLEAAMASVWRGNFLGGGVSAADATRLEMVVGDNGSAMPLGVVPCLVTAAKGCLWLVCQHTCFSVLFFLGGLAIWAFAGGAICRIAAVQFAREESIGFSEAIEFVKGRYAGLVLAPLIPAIAVLVIGFGLVMGGVFLSIPYLGDVVGSLLFGGALLVSVLIALLVLGACFGGHLFWPTIAVEGSDGLDAVSRSVNYVAARPWKAIGYGLAAMVYISLCYLLAKVFAFLILAGTHVFVGFGTSPFGWWGVREGIGSKLDALWSMPTMDLLRPIPGGASGIETFSSGVISCWVILVVALLWALMISLYFSASTIIYFLLRRDNDAMDLDDIYIDEYQEGVREPEPQAPKPTALEAAASEGVQVTVGGKPLDSEEKPTADEDSPDDPKPEDESDSD